jgi:5'-nucleotidase
VWGAIAERRKQLNAAGREALVIDNGDEFQGSPFFTYYKGNLTAKILGSLGFLSMQGCGNHEFDFGPAGLAKYLHRVQSQGVSAFPFRAHNVDVSNEPTLAGGEFAKMFYPNGYEILTVQGGSSSASKRVAIVGITTESTPETSSPGRVVFRDSIGALNELVPRLRSDFGVDHVIVSSHSGVKRDEQIIASVAGIDAIIGGHSHTLLRHGLGAHRPIVQIGAYGVHFGELTLCFPSQGGSLINYTAHATEVAQGRFPDHPAVKTLIEAAKPSIDAFAQEVIGMLLGRVEGREEFCRTGECSGGQLITAALLSSDYAVKNGAKIALVNGGGVRAGLKAGPLTHGDVLTANPFQNELIVCTLNGSTMMQALEHGVSQVYLVDGKIEYDGGAFPQLAGLRFVWNPRQPAGSRIVSTEPALRDDVRYTIITSGYIYGQGGDGYDMIKNDCENTIGSGPTDIDEIVRYVQHNNPLDPASFSPSSSYVRRLRGSLSARREDDYEAARGGAVRMESPSAEPPMSVVAEAERLGWHACVTGAHYGRATWTVCKN